MLLPSVISGHDNIPLLLQICDDSLSEPPTACSPSFVLKTPSSKANGHQFIPYDDFGQFPVVFANDSFSLPEVTEDCRDECFTTKIQIITKGVHAIRATSKIGKEQFGWGLDDQTISTLRFSKLFKPMMVPSRLKKLGRHLRGVWCEKKLSRKAKLTCNALKDLKSLAISSAISCKFITEFGLVENMDLWVPYLKRVTPCVKLAALGLTFRGVTKAYHFSSESKEMLQIGWGAKKEMPLLAFVQKIEQMGSKNLQKKLCLGKHSSLEERLRLISSRIQDEDTKEAIAQSAEFLKNLDFRAKLLYRLEACRLATKTAKFAGSLLVLTNIHPKLGKTLVHSAVIVSFLQRVCQRSILEHSDSLILPE
jgi:hypothetical protein